VPKNDFFSTALRSDLKKNNLTLEMAAERAKKSFRQFTRELRGETKLGLMSLETLAELRKEGVITENTVDAWWQTARGHLRFKASRKRKGYIRKFGRVRLLFR
jgi:hypothetical protein